MNGWKTYNSMMVREVISDGVGLAYSKLNLSISKNQDGKYTAMAYDTFSRMKLSKPMTKVGAVKWAARIEARWVDKGSL